MPHRSSRAARAGSSGLSLQLRCRTGIAAGATTGEPLALLESFGAAWGQKSTSQSSRASDQAGFQAERHYLRLHGRNDAQWWAHEKSEDRYNYLYSASELEPFAEAADRASRAGVYVHQQSLLGEGRGERSAAVLNTGSASLCRRTTGASSIEDTTPTSPASSGSCSHLAYSIYGALLRTSDLLNLDGESRPLSPSPRRREARQRRDGAPFHDVIWLDGVLRSPTFGGRRSRVTCLSLRGNLGRRPACPVSRSHVGVHLGHVGDSWLTDAG